jgi:protease I
MTKRILIVTGDAGESYETLYAYHRFLEAGFLPVIASTSKRRLHLVMHDFEPGWDTYVERPGYGLEATATFDEIDPATFDAILLIGGRAPEFLRHNERLIELVRKFDADEKWLFCICHGIQILVAAGVIKERSVTCYEHVRFEVQMAGGTWCTEQAVRDQRLVTAQTWQSHPEFYRLVFECLSS